jgi:citrate lyase subunit beta/citryl-CoA lyase
LDLMRTWMFVPGHRQRFIDKALGLDCDLIMLDIEDGVPPEEKPTARELIAEALGRERQPGSPTRYVRVNEVGHERMTADLATVVLPGLDGLVLPKVQFAEQVQSVANELDELEPKAGIAPGTVGLHIAIESPRGLFNALTIAEASPRVVGLMFGAEDYGWELGLPAIREGEAAELIHARSTIVAAARAAHVQVVDGVWPNLQDDEGLARDIVQSRRLGFSGKSLFHPSQIDPINAAFSPSPEEIDYCRRVGVAFDEAMARGDGSIAFGGQLIDRPIAERARATLRLAEDLGLA